MNRTRGRPLPRGHVSTEMASVFAASSGMIGCCLLATATTPTTATIAASTAMLYVTVYTPMKVMSGYNTHVGAIAGALPVLLGFSAAGASVLGPQALSLFALQTLWQFPHFYALAWLHRDDYIKGGFKMFPLVDKTGHETAKMIFPYMVGLAALPSVCALVGATSWMFTVDSLVANVLFSRSFTRFANDPNNHTVRKFFLSSLWYLIVMLALFTLHAKPMHEDGWREKFQERWRQLCAHQKMMESFSVLPDFCPIELGKAIEKMRL